VGYTRLPNDPRHVDNHIASIRAKFDPTQERAPRGFQDRPRSGYKLELPPGNKTPGREAKMNRKPQNSACEKKLTLNYFLSPQFFRQCFILAFLPHQFNPEMDFAKSIQLPAGKFSSDLNKMNKDVYVKTKAFSLTPA